MQGIEKKENKGKVNNQIVKGKIVENKKTINSDINTQKKNERNTNQIISNVNMNGKSQKKNVNNTQKSGVNSVKKNPRIRTVE